MQSSAASVEEYLDSLPEDRRDAISTVRDVVNASLPQGSVEQMDWGMISWVVPLETKPDTYNGRPLCYVALASQKRHLAVYLMGLYTDGPELEWFERQYAERGIKLDMGKSCVRFRRLEDLPLDVLGEVVGRIGVEEFIDRHDTARGDR